MQLTLKQLRYFVCAGENASVTKAAKAMFVSQPSISSAILHIEEQTGLDLFIRHHAQGLSLTPGGQRFLVKAKQLLEEADNLGKFATSLSEEVSGSLRFVSLPTFAPILLPSIMRKFVDLYEHVQVQCDEADQEKIIADLMSGKYEFALTYDLQLPAELEFIPLVEFPPYVMLAADHKLAKRKHLDIEDLAPEPMVLLDWPLSRDYFYSLFLSAGLEPSFAYKAKSLAMVRGLVANGFGYSLFNTPLASNATMDGNEIVQVPLVSKQGKHRPMSLGVVSVKGLRLSPVSNAFIEVVKQQLVNSMS
jgi:DNA-binding transcriptional LysR family regulator